MDEQSMLDWVKSITFRESSCTLAIMFRRHVMKPEGKARKAKYWKSGPMNLSFGNEPISIFLAKGCWWNYHYKNLCQILGSEWKSPENFCCTKPWLKHYELVSNPWERRLSVEKVPFGGRTPLVVVAAPSVHHTHCDSPPLPPTRGKKKVFRPRTNIVPGQERRLTSYSYFHIQDFWIVID